MLTVVHEPSTRTDCVCITCAWHLVFIVLKLSHNIQFSFTLTHTHISSGSLLILYRYFSLKIVVDFFFLIFISLNFYLGQWMNECARKTKDSFCFNNSICLSDGLLNRLVQSHTCHYTNYYYCYNRKIAIHTFRRVKCSENLIKIQWK